jgi:hypothetical protein
VVQDDRDRHLVFAASHARERETIAPMTSPILQTVQARSDGGG